MKDNNFVKRLGSIEIMGRVNNICSDHKMWLSKENEEIREEAPHAVKTCAQAGVRIRMVTGDNKTNAIDIAKKCGIIQGEEEENQMCVCMEGAEFNDFVGSLVDKTTGEKILNFGELKEVETIGNLDAMRKVRDNLKVLANARPEDKYIMVAGLKQLGEVVAVTGDGEDDVPVLMTADVSFAAQTGTDSAHSVADDIIHDDNFASVVKAFKWGRNLNDYFRRFIQFQLTVNLVAITVSFITSVLILNTPLQII